MASEAVDPLAELARLEGVPSAMAAARDAVDAVLRDRGRRQVSREQSATALLSAARASVALEADRDRDWEPAAVRLYVELAELSGLVRVSPGQAIARAHAVLARGIVDDAQLGRVRAEDDLGARLAALQRALTAKTSAPVIVIGAIAHAELITIAPFAAGNGIVARAVEHMILIDGDIDRPAATVPEAGHQQLRPSYQHGLSRYRTGTADGVRDWLLHVAAAVSLGAELSPLAPPH